MAATTRLLYRAGDLFPGQTGDMGSHPLPGVPYVCAADGNAGGQTDKRSLCCHLSYRGAFICFSQDHTRDAVATAAPPAGSRLATHWGLSLRGGLFSPDAG